MVYRVDLDMGLNEYAVSRAIKELEERGLCTSHERIARHIGCSTTTVWRACGKLVSSGRVQRLGTGQRDNGHTYRTSKWI